MEKINIAELLKDCPKGMELDSTIVNGLYFDEVTFDEVTENNLIKCYTKFNSTYNTIYFYSDGSYLNHTCSKCVIFPKGKTTWEGFHRPFDDGDIVATEHGLFIGIVRVKNNMQVNAYCSINDSGCFGINSTYGFERIATEEEKQKLFEAIKENGYKWNAETKTLEKLIEPKFKAGDTIQDEDGYKVEIYKVDIDEECYEYMSTIAKGIGSIPFERQDEWELVQNKFDITTLKPFDKVLTRYGDSQRWSAELFSFYDNESEDYCFRLIGTVYARYCIPYEGNEHLVGTTNDCDDFYKTWE